jgi:hypothetical protein
MYVQTVRERKYYGNRQKSFYFVQTVKKSFYSASLQGVESMIE